MAHIYIAAPFFGKRQKGLLQEIARLGELVGRGLYFSSSADNILRRTSRVVGESVLAQNKKKIEEAEAVVAVLDWRFDDPATKLAVLTPEKVVAVSLPDTGTVWEMGYAVAAGKPVVGLTLQAVLGRQNLMLALSCVGFCYTLPQLAAYFAHGKKSLSPWKGAVL